MACGEMAVEVTVEEDAGAAGRAMARGRLGGRSKSRVCLIITQTGSLDRALQQAMISESRAATTRNVAALDNANDLPMARGRHGGQLQQQYQQSCALLDVSPYHVVFANDALSLDHAIHTALRYSKQRLQLARIAMHQHHLRQNIGAQPTSKIQAQATATAAASASAAAAAAARKKKNNNNQWWDPVTAAKSDLLAARQAALMARVSRTFRFDRVIVGGRGCPDTAPPAKASTNTAPSASCSITAATNSSSTTTTASLGRVFAHRVYRNTGAYAAVRNTIMHAQCRLRLLMQQRGGATVSEAAPDDDQRVTAATEAFHTYTAETAAATVEHKRHAPLQHKKAHTITIIAYGSTRAEKRRLLFGEKRSSSCVDSCCHGGERNHSSSTTQVQCGPPVKQYSSLLQAVLCDTLHGLSSHHNPTARSWKLLVSAVIIRDEAVYDALSTTILDESVTQVENIMTRPLPYPKKASSRHQENKRAQRTRGRMARALRHDVNLGLGRARRKRPIARGQPLRVRSSASGIVTDGSRVANVSSIQDVHTLCTALCTIVHSHVDVAAHVLVTATVVGYGHAELRRQSDDADRATSVGGDGDICVSDGVILARIQLCEMAGIENLYESTPPHVLATATATVTTSSANVTAARVITDPHTHPVAAPRSGDLDPTSMRTLRVSMPVPDVKRYNVSRGYMALESVLRARGAARRCAAATTAHGGLDGGGGTKARHTDTLTAIRRHRFVPYRDSVLTSLLKCTLSQRSGYTIVLGCVEGDLQGLSTTLGSVRLADRLRRFVSAGREQDDDDDDGLSDDDVYCPDDDESFGANADGHAGKDTHRCTLGVLDMLERNSLRTLEETVATAALQQAEQMRLERAENTAKEMVQLLGDAAEKQKQLRQEEQVRRQSKKEASATVLSDAVAPSLSSLVEGVDLHTIPASPFNIASADGIGKASLRSGHAAAATGSAIHTASHTFVHRYSHTHGHSHVVVDAPAVNRGGGIADAWPGIEFMEVSDALGMVPVAGDSGAVYTNESSGNGSGAAAIDSVFQAAASSAPQAVVGGSADTAPPSTSTWVVRSPAVTPVRPAAVSRSAEQHRRRRAGQRRVSFADEATSTVMPFSRATIRPTTTMTHERHSTAAGSYSPDAALRAAELLAVRSIQALQRVTSGLS